MTDSRIQEPRRLNTPSEDVPETAESVTPPSIAIPGPSALEVFHAWEELRFLYNAILVLIIFCFGSSQLRTRLSLSSLLLLMLLANVCFCAGSVGENYLCLLHCDRGAARIIVFLIGTVVSILFAGGALSVPAF